MKTITLLTDFGLADGYAGVLKGVIWGIAPQVHIADLTHLIQPQNVLEGALTLLRCAPYFPEGTVHLAVVDPGVGTQRRAMAARLGDWYFVGPDNGLASLLLAQVRRAGGTAEFIQLTNPRYQLAQVSSVFHGRDIFAPAAAHLANGVPLAEFGEPFDDPLMIELPQPSRMEDGWVGQVIHVDAFGNLATNLTRANLPESGQILIQIGGQAVKGLVKSFGDGNPGDLVALLDSAGFLSVCVVNGSAARQLQAGFGAIVRLHI